MWVLLGLLTLGWGFNWPLMIPIVGVFSGIWLLGESPQWPEYAALVLVIAALATVLMPPRRTAPASTFGSPMR